MCEWETGTAQSFLGGWQSANEYTADRRLEWLEVQNVIEQEEFMLRSIKGVADPDIKGLNWFLFGHARHSSHPGAPTMAQTMQNLLQTITSFNNLMNSPLHQGSAEAQRPGGPGTPMQSHRTVIARHGARPIITHTGNVDDPQLHAWLATLNHIFRPNNPHPPAEIHFLMLGLAGFSVGIDGFGDRAQGLFRYLLDCDAANGTNLASRIYLVFVLEPHVVDPNSPSSINFGQQRPGVRFLNKQVVKVKLEYMIDRYDMLKNDAIAMGRPFMSYMEEVMKLYQGLPSIFNNFPLPNFPAQLGGAGMAATLDIMIQGMFWEKAWRVGWLDGNTSPTAAAIHANNTNRNTAM